MHEHVEGFLSKCTVLKVDLLQDHQIYCLEACMCELFSPGILQAVAVKGLSAQLPLTKQWGDLGCWPVSKCGVSK